MKISELKNEQYYKEFLRVMLEEYLIKIEKLDNQYLRKLFSTTLSSSEIFFRTDILNPPEIKDLPYTSLEEIPDNAFIEFIKICILAQFAYYFESSDQIPIKDKRIVIDTYNSIYQTSYTLEDMVAFSKGLSQDGQFGYSEKGNYKKMMEVLEIDAEYVGTKLLKALGIESDKKSSVMLGTKLWKAYEQIVQPGFFE